MKCVVLCAGSGKRLGADVPKPLLKITGKTTILQTILDTWRSCVDGFIIVANPSWAERFEKTLQTFEPLPFVVTTQSEPRGIADAILSAEPFVDEKFVVVLGDCLCKGTWLWNSNEEIERGVGWWVQSDVESIRKGYGIIVAENRVVALSEKPADFDIKTVKCGMGVYFLDQKVFEYIQTAFPSKLRNEVEITDVLQTMVEDKQTFKAVPFAGQYININTQEDLEKAREIWGNPKRDRKQKMSLNRE